MGELESATPTPDDLVARNYTNVFPNVSVSYSDQAVTFSIPEAPTITTAITAEWLWTEIYSLTVEELPSM